MGIVTKNSLDVYNISMENVHYVRKNCTWTRKTNAKRGSRVAFMREEHVPAALPLSPTSTLHALLKVVLN